MKTYKTSRGVDYTLEAITRAGSHELVLVTITGHDWATRLFPRVLKVKDGNLDQLNTEIDARIAGEIARRAQTIAIRRWAKDGTWEYNLYFYDELMLTMKSRDCNTHATGLSEITELLETLEK